jgi:lipopolysaccharide biosynthesis regulator YciM
MGNSPAVQFLAGAFGALLVLAGAWLLRGRRERSVERVPDAYTDGLRLLVEGRPTEAFARLQQAVVAGNAPTDAYVRIGRMLRERGDAARALQIHRSLTVKSDLTRQEKVEVFANVAEDHAALGHPERALATVETLMRRTGLREPALLGIAMRACHAMGRSEEAYEYLKEMRKSGEVGDREMALYLVSVAEKDMEKGRARDARKTLARALRHDAECAPALLSLGGIEERSEDADAAMRHWRHAARISPELSSTALRNLERLLYQRGTFNEIEAVYREMLEARPGDEGAAAALASFYRKQGRTEEAIALLEEHAQANPESVAATVLLASIYAARGDEDELERVADRGRRLLHRPENFKCVCGFETSVMRWHCPECNRFDSFTRNSR